MSRYPALPPTVDGAVELIQRYIDDRQARMFPQGAATALRDMVAQVSVRGSAKLVAERAKLAKAGFDPDVLAPLPVDHKPVAFMARVMTFPETTAHRWLEDAGFAPSDIADAMSRLRFAPDGLAEALEDIQDRTVVEGNRVLDVVVDRDPGAVPHPLTVTQVEADDGRGGRRPRRR